MITFSKVSFGGYVKLAIANSWQRYLITTMLQLDEFQDSNMA
ncbi:hypothetical protein APA_674 [Pseudanabaena sp. lw0831]|nr:hypothetical protein [Pseudanabaena sp. lw0831]GBO52873.1 hypothetical protein APA_674 [Pseudanabaena sp. lw0831]